MRLATGEEMRAIDRTAIDELGVPGLALMERAGRAVAEAALALAGPGGRFLVLCGAGNNGGDGYVAARLLSAAGRAVELYALAPVEKLGPDARAMREEALAKGLAPRDAPALGRAEAGAGDVVVDAIFGTGLSRPPEGALAEGIAAAGRLREAGARVLAVDVPSGLAADTGDAPGACVRADRTVTFGLMKRGLVFFPGAELAGEVTVADIGLPPAALARVPARLALLGAREARALVPRRERDAHKGDAGRLLAVAGSAGKTGAAHLCLLGALRGGVGLAWLASRPEVLPLALGGLPEAMSLALPGEGPLGERDLAPLLEAAMAVDALVAGPGIPRGPATGPLLRELLARSGKPAVLDADALNALADAPGAVGPLPPSAVLTPHPGELARLLRQSIADVQRDRVATAVASAEALGCTVVLKGARTVVAAPGEVPWVIPTGNPGMATGGTGDVLAGLTGALLAGGIAPFDAARAAAWAHGRAGDLAARRLGERGLLASDLAHALGEVWVEWER
ncbi:NAD(P)H-hydrate dehydratase [Anaeromyxobacter paludicola]|uniref:Bifunctional NAD(P)H-hydrate repair enzyme n=1 Tax=Anaeromyxobacter paludicola TaxID=2918171 RepID=A0ABM7X7Q9_9BACT|nr:NAD(P)H-hydrate dehydratase [Anaeromyxobacter paludicola]BDG07847.1 bifunctional NAD(P)H-hydrate repair enzyme Nnr [Anaeromyxobacter paludicola]